MEKIKNDSNKKREEKEKEYNSLKEEIMKKYENNQKQIE